MPTAAQKRPRGAKRATRVVHVGDEAYPILEMTRGTAFSVEADTAPRLRRLFIDIYDGPQAPSTRR